MRITGAMDQDVVEMKRELRFGNDAKPFVFFEACGNVFQ